MDSSTKHTSSATSLGKLKFRLISLATVTICFIVGIVWYCWYDLSYQLSGKCCSSLKKWHGMHRSEVTKLLGAPSRTTAGTETWIGVPGEWWTFTHPKLELFIEDNSGKVTHGRLYDHDHFFEL